MDNKTLYVPGFHLSTLRKTPRSAGQKLLDQQKQIRQKSLAQLGECFSNFIPTDLIKQEDSGAFSRRRIFSKENTFWAFFSQVLDADGGCQVQALAVSKGLKPPSSSTSAYCQAR